MDCLDLQLADEEIVSNGWFCPFCKKKQKKFTKQLKFSSLPDVLILHLKRFKALEGKRSKLNTLINYPITGLDLTRYLAGPPQRHKAEYDLYSGKHFLNFNNFK